MGSHDARPHCRSGLARLPGREWVSQRPPVRRTWAPRGKTPVLIHAFNWTKLSIALALAFRWDGRCSRLFFQTRPGSYNDVTLIGLLNDLKRHVHGQRVILIWDGLPSHKSREMAAYLRGQRHWLSVERLPGYAPDLNSTELVWGNVKRQELANLCADSLGGVEVALRAGMRRVPRQPTLAFAFLRHIVKEFRSRMAHDCAVPDGGRIAVGNPVALL